MILKRHIKQIKIKKMENKFYKIHNKKTVITLIIYHNLQIILIIYAIRNY